MNHITELYKYFAKFPALAGVQRSFIRNPNDTAYTTLKAEIAALTPNSLIPTLANYIFSINTVKLAERVKNMTDDFLMIEYGSINESESQKYKVLESSIELSVIVATSWHEKNKDEIDEVITMNRLLLVMKSIMDTMKADNAQNCEILRRLVFPDNISPIEPANFYEKIGWVARFQSRDNNIAY